MRTSLISRLALVVALVVALGSCGGKPEVIESANTAQARAVGLPEPIPAVAAYVVATKQALRPAGVAGLEDVTGVAVVAPLTREELKVTGPEGAVRLSVGAVDALRYRSVAPTATRDADFVWTSLLAGEAVVTPEAARRLGLGRGGKVRLPGYGQVSVGAFADNGSPNLADVLVDISVGQAAGIDANHLLVVGARSGVTIEKLGRDLAGRLPAARLRRLSPPATGALEAPTPAGTASGGLIGTMRFAINDDGTIVPDPAWVAANIATGNVPILGRVVCHRLMLPQLGAALAAVQEAGLAGAIRLRDYGGCYNPRFIDRDPSKPLSMHAFGLAIDFNTTTNALGTRGDLHPEVVAIFERWGFEWGGRWARPDPMHFELARLIAP